MHPPRTRPVRRVTSLLAWSAALGLVAALPAGGASAAGVVAGVSTATPVTAPRVTSTPVRAATVTVPDDLRVHQTRTSLLGTHRWYQQLRDNRVVYDGWYATHTDAQGNVTVWDGRRDVSEVSATSATMSLAQVLDDAASAADATAADVVDSSLLILPADRPTGEAHLAWAVHTTTGRGAATTFVDAEDGTILDVVETASEKSAPTTQPDGTRETFSVTGRGRVFDPNPVVKLQNQSLRDRNDSNAAVPARGYTVVNLPRLSADHTLLGKWVRITNADRATSPENRYFFRRAAGRFEQVTAYHAVDAQQHYLQALGFTDVNAEAQQVKVNAFAADNSYYDSVVDKISLGRGGVDDAEDPEVLWHEFGHAIQSDQVPGWGFGGQTGAMGEGFGDYIAVTMSQATSRNTARTPAACVMDWDATSYTRRTPHCLRRTDRSKSFPDDLTGQVHADGEIWSRALWDINRKLGRDRATRIIVEAQFWMNPQSRMPAAARTTVNAAEGLYDAEVAAKVRHQFVNRGILEPVETVAGH